MNSMKKLNLTILSLFLLFSASSKAELPTNLYGSIITLERISVPGFIGNSQSHRPNRSPIKNTTLPTVYYSQEGQSITLWALDGYTTFTYYILNGDEVYLTEKCFLDTDDMLHIPISEFCNVPTLIIEVNSQFYLATILDQE